MIYHRGISSSQYLMIVGGWNDNDQDNIYLFFHTSIDELFVPTIVG